MLVEAAAVALRRHLAAGTDANTARDWKSACIHYARALELDPSLWAIWVQYGHALKEQGRLEEAEDAYRRSLAITPENCDTWLQLGHVLKLRGKLKHALAAYVRAWEIDPMAHDPQVELAHLTRLDFAGLGPRRGNVLAPEPARMSHFRAEARARLALLASYLRTGAQVVSVWPNARVALGPRVAVFVHFDPDCHVQSFVVDHVAALHAAGLSVVFASNCPTLDQASLERMRPYCAAIMLRHNLGHDFGAVRDALRLLGLPRDNTQSLLIANDSVFGPLQDIGPILERIDFDTVDLWGATESWQHRYHLQSFFLVAGRRALTSPAWEKFWRRVRLVQSRYWVVQRYEIGLTQAMLSGGLRCAAIWPYDSLAKMLPPPDPNDAREPMMGADPASDMRHGHLDRIRNHIASAIPMNPTAEFWRQLLQAGFPFIKRELLRKNPARVADLADWRDVVRTVSKIDLAPIDAQLRRELTDRAI
jgi:tetratricopeptide (TPR) repeat protein